MVRNYLKRGLATQEPASEAPRHPGRKNSAASAENASHRPGWTAEAVESFRAKGMSYEIETPLCPEHIWIVPRKTGKDRVEFTPEEMAFLLQAMEALDGKIVEIGRRRPDTEDDAMSSNCNTPESRRVVR